MLAYIPQNMSRKRSIPFRAATTVEVAEQNDEIPLPKRTRTAKIDPGGYRETSGEEDEEQHSLDLFVIPQAPRSRRVASIKAQMANTSLFLSEHRHRSRSSSPNETSGTKNIEGEDDKARGDPLRGIVVGKGTETPHEPIQDKVGAAAEAEVTETVGSSASSLSPLSSHESELEEEKQQPSQQQLQVKPMTIKGPFAAKIRTPVLNLVPVVEKTSAKNVVTKVNRSNAKKRQPSPQIQGYVRRIASLNARACVSAMMDTGRRPYRRKVPSNSPSTSTSTSPTKEDILTQSVQVDEVQTPQKEPLVEAKDTTQPSSEIHEASRSWEPTRSDQGGFLGPILGKGPGYVLLCASPSTLTQCGIIHGSNPDNCPYNTEGLLWSGDTIHPHARVYLTPEGTVPSLVVPPICPVRPHCVREEKERALEVKKLKKPRAVKGDNGWCVIGDPIKEILLPQKEGPKVSRRYYAGIRRKNEELWVRDCITVRSGKRKKDRPFVAKIGSIWRENGGAVMTTLFWYYRPEETTGVQITDFQQNEILASQHYDDNSVACIEDQCHVLGLRQYCRYLASRRSITEGIGTLDSFSVTRGSNPDGIGQFAQSNTTTTTTTTTTTRHKKKKKSPCLVFLCHRGYNHIAGRLLKSHKH